MKRILCSFAFCLSILTTNAQIHWGFRIGASKTKVHFLNDKQWQPSDWEVLMLAEIKIIAGLQIQPEIGWGSRHTYYYSRSPSHNIVWNYALQQLEANLLFQYRVFDQKLKLIPFAGVSTGTAISGNVHTKGGGVTTHGSAFALDETKDLNFDGDFTYARFVIGPTLGFSLQIPLKKGCLLLDCRYSRYTLNSQNCETCEASEQNVSIGAGYLFGVGN